MNKEQLSKDIKELKAKLADMEEQLNGPEQFELKYKPNSTFLLGPVYVGYRYDGTDENYLKSGRYRATEEYANKSLERNKRANRLETLVEQVSIELGMIDWEPDWSDNKQSKWCIEYIHNRNKWVTYHANRIESPETVYMPEEVAERVCEILNNKEYKL